MKKGRYKMSWKNKKKMDRRMNKGMMGKNQQQQQVHPLGFGVQMGEKLLDSSPVKKKEPVKEVVKEPRRRDRLVFSPYAWAKLLWFRYRGDSEVSGFGISSIADPLFVVDFVTVLQEVSGVTTQMDDVGVADFFEDMHEKGLQPCEYGRIWIHTHPDMAPNPSGTDMLCFNKVFGKCDWSVMMILGGAEGKQETLCRLKFNVGPGTTIELPTVEIDWRVPFPGTDYGAWEQEYKDNVKEDVRVAYCCIPTHESVDSIAGETYGAAEGAEYVDDPDYMELWQRGMDGDALALSELTCLTCTQVEELKEAGFDGGQIAWYDAELISLDGPEDLDQWEEEQRVATGGTPGSMGNTDEDDEYNSMYNEYKYLG
jgi:proteasome lid subunit RPN8/RPN11